MSATATQQQPAESPAYATVTLIAKIADREAYSRLMDSFRNDTDFHGIRFVMIGRGDQVTKPNEIVEELAGFDADWSIDRARLKDLVKRAEDALPSE